MKDRIRLQFLGAAGYVTGSRSLIEYNNTRVYVDCGMYQGPRYIEEKNYHPLETAPETLDAVILTHAHIDHSGLLPLLVKKGFQGKIYCTPATAELLQVLLPDAGRIQEEEFKFLSKKKIRDFELDGPLFNEDDAKKVFEFIVPIDFKTAGKIKDIEFTFYWAGHILGAAGVQVKAGEKTINFSGDIGPINSILHREREIPPPADFLVMESTYGKRKHENENIDKKFQKAVKSVIQRKSMLIIPAFAVGRTQLVLYVIYRLMRSGKIPELPVFIDSPMAAKATRIYMQYPEELQKNVVDEGFLEFLHSRQIKLIEAVEESKQLNYYNGPGILISASGMCHGGRIMHHLFNRMWDRRNFLLFAGYQAEGTLGRQILEGASRVKIFRREIPVRCSIDTINSFSAHADRVGLVKYAETYKASPPKILFINHGEDDSRDELKKQIRLGKDTRIELPKSEEVYYL